MPRQPQPVLVHTCYSLESYERQPLWCSCKRRVTREEARAMVRGGVARYVVRYDRRKPYEDDDAVCVEKTQRTPRSATIDEEHIYRANGVPNRKRQEGRDRGFGRRQGGDHEEQLRIEWYGILTLAARVCDTKGKLHLLNFEPDGGREQEANIPVMQFFEDNRTTKGLDSPPKP